MDIVYTIASGATIEGKTAQTINGTNFTITNQTVSADASGNEFEYQPLTGDATSVIELDIPSGTYGATVSSLFGKVLFTDYAWDSNISVDHWIENATENSGWVADGVPGTLKALTSEQTKHIIRLTGDSSDIKPFIRGAGVYIE